MTTHELDKIKKSIAEGKSEQAKTAIQKWIKKNSATPSERVTLSELYSWLGEDSSAWKILGPIPSLNELQGKSHLNLGLHFRQCYILGMLGAKYISNRLYDFLESQVSETQLKKIYPQFFQNRGYLFISQYLPEKALHHFLKASELYPIDDHRQFFIQLGIADSYAMLGAFEKSKAIIEKLKLIPSFLKGELLAILYQAEGEYLNYLGLSEQSFKALSLSHKCFTGLHLKENKDYAYLLKHMGLNLCWAGKAEEGIEYLLRAKKILLKSDGTPTSLLEIIYWIEIYAPEVLSIEERVLVRFYPQYSVYAERLGRVYEQRSPKICPWVPQDKDNKESHWLVHQSKMISLSYAKTREQMSQQCIDFEARVFWNKNQCEILSVLESQLLLTLFGAGKRGVHLYHLSDTIYRHEFTSWEHGIDRIKKQLKALKQRGFQVLLDNNNVIWSWDTNMSYILRNDLNCGSPLQALECLSGAPVSASQLKEAFGVSLRTAQRWIKAPELGE
ncbi:MAG: hypothetical protein COV37_05390 [Bdellovibrio sp. CG11_big_fil_rev_8_21_14_0_20_39_38]|nr:MAG: hypothetical protein COW78_10465 [Bdellovibrio sp. CG22_combo_CG10-13_8_21_14_all_39_27]PIR36085.1 MAG: hypothetical protein COV37_05390 [Bdellovibrio sp. CG11_big_fil_rev_8_21_14_0_20_39_38]